MMSVMDDLTAFIGDRLDEDERVARAGLEYDGKVDHRYHAGPGGELLGGISLSTYHYHYRPKRALRDAEAGRRVLERHRDCVPWGNGPCEHAGTTGEPPCPDMRDLLSRWSDHPDYRQEWALD
jgi:hypothetical protein